jgi:IclR family acetate operon transcriptional repressor
MESRRGSEGAGNLRAGVRILDIVDYLAGIDIDAPVNEIAQSTAIPLPTLYRLLRLLNDRAYVRETTTGRYGLGPHLIRLGEAASAALGTAAKHILRKLATQTGETVNMAMRDGDEVVYIAQAQPPDGPVIRMFIEPGRRVHPHCTALGKALLAQLPKDEATAILKRSGLPALTSATITDEAILLDELNNVRKRGYAVDEGEEEEGLNCIAVPITGLDINIAVGVSGPASRLHREAQGRVLPLLQETANEVARTFGPTAKRFATPREAGREKQ